MPKLVTIFGGSGFVGRYIAQRMARQGWRVRVAVRRPNEAHFVRPYGRVGQVDPILCNIRYEESVRQAMLGSDAVVNCVGTFDARGKNNFDAVQNEGAARIARIAAETGVSKVVHISAIGADVAGDSKYARSKGQGEAAVLAACPNAVILRPSVIFGPEDQFFNRFAGMARTFPIVPLVGAETRFQPVYVDDVAQAAERAIVDGVKAGVYELGGPDVATFKDLIAEMLTTIRRRRLILSLPFWAGSTMGYVTGAVSFVTGGLAPQPITVDQVKSLRHDNVVAEDAMTFDDLGISPSSVEAIVPSYLWQFRPSGQYAELKESASNLR